MFFKNLCNNQVQQRAARITSQDAEIASLRHELNASFGLATAHLDQLQRDIRKQHAPIRFNLIQFNSIQFNSIQFNNLIQFNSIQLH
jgi:hypothetical protein